MNLDSERLSLLKEIGDFIADCPKKRALFNLFLDCMRGDEPATLAALDAAVERPGTLDGMLVEVILEVEKAGEARH